MTMALQDWPDSGLEHLGQCPVCGSLDRTVLYRDIADRLFGAPGRWTMHLCEDCGSGYLDPRPTVDTVNLAYANYETHRPAVASYATGEDRLALRLRNGYLNTKYGYEMQPASPLGYMAMHLLPAPLRLEWDHFARHLPKPALGRDKLLDVGCGNGEFLLRAKSQGWSPHGIDFDGHALQHAIEAGIPVIQGDVEISQFAPESFDAVTSHQVIEHVHDPSRFLSAIHAWLKPNGRVWIGTPNITSDLRMRFGPDWYPLQAPGHLQIFSPGALEKSMQMAGFSEIEVLPRGYNESHYHRVSTKLRTTIGRTSNAVVTSGREASLSVLEMFLLEFAVWMNPRRGSDLVVTARKPTR